MQEEQYQEIQLKKKRRLLRAIKFKMMSILYTILLFIGAKPKYNKKQIEGMK